MKLHPLALVAVLLFVLAVGFAVGVFVQSRHPLLVAAPAGDPASVPKPEPSATKRDAARKTALREYLDGKELKDKDGKPVLGANGKPLVFRKADIQAVQLADTASRSGDTPWHSSATVLSTADGKRYSVHGTLEYRDVADSIAIVSFTPTEVAPQ